MNFRYKIFIESYNFFFCPRKTEIVRGVFFRQVQLFNSTGNSVNSEIALKTSTINNSLILKKKNNVKPENLIALTEKSNPKLDMQHPSLYDLIDQMCNIKSNKKC